MMLKLKTKKKRQIDSQCAELLAPSDWYVVKQQKHNNNGFWMANLESKCENKM